MPFVPDSRTGGEGLLGASVVIRPFWAPGNLLRWWWRTGHAEGWDTGLRLPREGWGPAEAGMVRLGWGLPSQWGPPCFLGGPSPRSRGDHCPDPSRLQMLCGCCLAVWLMPDPASPCASCFGCHVTRGHSEWLAWVDTGGTKEPSDEVTPRASCRGGASAPVITPSLPPPGLHVSGCWASPITGDPSGGDPTCG